MSSGGLRQVVSLTGLQGRVHVQSGKGSATGALPSAPNALPFADPVQTIQQLHQPRQALINAFETLECEMERREREESVPPGDPPPGPSPPAPKEDLRSPAAIAHEIERLHELALPRSVRSATMRTAQMHDRPAGEGGGQHGGIDVDTL